MKEFKEFISKGNVIEMAVGLIIATYFGAIIKSFVDNIVMPPIGKLIGGVDFSDLKFILNEAIPAQLDTNGAEIAKAMPEIAIGYGTFLNSILTFLIVAFAVFLVVKQYNKMKKKKEKPVTGPSKEEVLLTEIRDLLKK
jgi:large conductance mechanosensitive channel